MLAGFATVAGMRKTEGRTRTYRVVAGVTRPFVRRAFGLDATGRENLPFGGFVICANHLSALDPSALSEPLYPRQPCFLAKAELFRKPVRPLLARMGMYPVHRGVCRVSTIAAAIAHARAGRVVLMFPKGSRRSGRPDRPEPPRLDVSDLDGLPARIAARDATRRAWRQVELLEEKLRCPA